MATSQPARSSSRRGLDLRGEIRAFLDEHPHGWSHDAWTGFLGNLQTAGYRTSDPEMIGRELEAARLHRVLDAKNIRGLGPRRRSALVDRFGRLWNLRQASVEQIAEVAGINRNLAEQVRSAVE